MASDLNGVETRQRENESSARNEHPVAPILAYARVGYRRIEEHMRDYTCTLTRRERVAGTLGGYQQLSVKIRHHTQSHPFSVYLRFLGPADVKDREVLFVTGQRNGDILVRRGGARLPNMTLQLNPNGRLAMEGNRYPITEIGVKMMVMRFIEVLEEDLMHEGVQVNYFKNAKLNGRDCSHFQVVHPIRREGIRYHMARVLVDNDLQVPVYFASYGWPTQQGGQPLLLEEYIYSNIRLNVGLADNDFQRSNPEYGFRVIDQAANVRD
jgi:hypothetical protein